MKSSRYNLFLPFKGEYALFNTLSNSVLIVDKDMKECIEGRCFQTLSDNEVASLASLGILVEDDIDERLIFANLYNRIVYSNRELRFVVITTYKCNLACPYCYEGMGEAIYDSMDEKMAWQIIQAIEDKVISDGAKSLKVMLFGGEPLLNQDIGLKIFKELSSWSKEHNIGLDGAMVTNGTLVTPSVIEKFVPYLHAVQLTLDGSKPFHDKKRVHKDGQGTYDEVLSALRSFRNAGICVSLRVQVALDNVSNLADLLKDLGEEGLLRDPGLRLSIYPLKRLTDLCGNFGSFIENDDVAAMIQVWKYDPNQTLRAQIVPCHVYSGLYIIDPLGDVYKCISAVGKKEHAVGTAKDGEILLDYGYYDFMTRDPLEISECRDCVYLPICGGGCPHMANRISGTYHAPYCGSTKALVDMKVLFDLENKYHNGVQC
ncbi:MAG: pyrroloquinoline quinone biosynthesis protein PqqE [Methanosaeta sp. PtaU1.Bin112]|nr:MAG: pyrroloquinoline quinone biosynthesis protein PqqE [Methanosaeta sp. PtaU1.Bin112]